MAQICAKIREMKKHSRKHLKREFGAFWAQETAFAGTARGQKQI